MNLIIGVNGQLGSYMLDDWTTKYNVVGTVRRSSTNNFERINHNMGKFELVEMDITDAGAVSGVFNKYKPDYVINAVAQSHVHTSFTNRAYTAQTNYIGVINCLDAIVNISPKSKFITCSTSEMFGSQYDIDENGVKYQDENTAKIPNSPYGNSKIAAHFEVDMARRYNNIWASCAINFNFESPRRGENFVTRKITKWIGGFKKWAYQFGGMYIPEYKSDYIHAHGCPSEKRYPKLRLGNIYSKRDWNFCGDIVDGINKMFELDSPDDFVFCSGKSWAIEDFIKLAFNRAGIYTDYRQYIVIDEKFYRPIEVEYLHGKNDKARKVLGWEPKVHFNELVNIMVDHDIEQERI